MAQASTVKRAQQLTVSELREALEAFPGESLVFIDGERPMRSLGNVARRRCQRVGVGELAPTCILEPVR